MIGRQGLLTKIIRGDKSSTLNNQDPSQICLMAIKCIISLLTIDENKVSGQSDVSMEAKEQTSQIIVDFLLNGCPKSCDETLYCKVC